MGARPVAVGLPGQQVRRRIVVRPRRMRPVGGLRLRACHAPAFMIRLTRRRDMTICSRRRAALIFLAPYTPAAVPPHSFHVRLMWVGPLGFGVFEHPVVGGLRDV